MAATKPKDEAAPDIAGKTLGDVIYGDGREGITAEAEWVAIVRSIAGGDQRALQDLYQRTHRAAFTLIVRIVGKPETAEEVTLDVFHDLWRRAGGYDPAAGTVLAWVMNQARSRAIDRIRFEQRRKRTMPAGGPPTDAFDPGPEDLAGVAQRDHALRSVVAALAPDERQAIELSYFSGLTYAEVAARLCQPLGTVKTRIRTALGKLRQALAGG